MEKGIWEGKILSVSVAVELGVEGGNAAARAGGAEALDLGPARARFTIRDIAPGEAALDIEIGSTGAEPFILKQLRIVATPRVRNIHRLRTATTTIRNRADYSSYIWQLQEFSLACLGVPFIQGHSRDGESAFLMGFVEQTRDTIVRHDALHGEQGDRIEHTQFSLTRPAGDWESWKTDSWRETIYFSTAPKTWFAALEDYARFADSENKPLFAHVPEACLGPVWCSWYSHRQEIDADQVRANALEAKKLGMKTILVDAGWFEPEESADPAYPLGRIAARKERFPDMPGLVKELQREGLRVLLWTGPIFWGGPADCDARAKLKAITKSGEFDRYICPRYKESAGVAGRLIGDAMRRFGLDGVKIDFMDIGPAECFSTAHSHDYPTVGEGMDVVFRELHRAVTEVRPDALIEYRMNYSNLNTRQYANIFRSDDAPYDHDQIRREIAMIKPWAGPVVPHADYAYWPPDEPAENKARFMASILWGCVPTISMDLTTMSAGDKALIKAWLEFYEKHRNDLVHGKFEPLTCDAHFSVSRIAGEKAVFYGLFGQHCPARLDAGDVGGKDIYLINGTAGGKLMISLDGLKGFYEVAILDSGLEAGPQSKISADRVLRLDSEVAIGGLLRLSSVD